VGCYGETRGDLEGGDALDAGAEGLGGGGVGGRLAGLEGLEEAGEVLSQVRRDDGGRGLARAEAEVVAGARDGAAEEVAVAVDSVDNGGDDGWEDGRVARGGGDLGGVEEVDAVGGAEGPVVVLARAVDAGEGLLVEEAGEVVPRGHLGRDLHDHQVLV
jgi:hypothetical protein